MFGDHLSDKVSIIIPVYNAEKYLAECIESAFNQTYPNIEIIAVDDGSTDSSKNILKKFQDKIKVILKENGGTASALNVGIKNMTGEWFKWLSADDLLYPNAVEELVKAAKKKSNPKNSILYSNFEMIDSLGNVIGKQIEPNYNDLDDFEFNVILLDHFVGNAITSLIHKSALDEYGLFDKNIGLLEDSELWLRYSLLHNCRLYLIPKILAQYRVHESQLTKTKILKSIETGAKLRKIVLEKLKPELREKYLVSLKKFKKSKPFSVRSRRVLRNVMVKYLPSSLSTKVLKIYLESKNN